VSSTEQPSSTQHGYGPLDICGRRIGYRCNHIDPERCCGGGYDAPCGCTECHPTAEMPSNPRAVYNAGYDPADQYAMLYEVRDAAGFSASRE
jgi:hypothetical protein